MSAKLNTAIGALRSARTIVVVGFSRHPGKEAHDIPVYMSRIGYRVIGVNPTMFTGETAASELMVSGIQVVPTIDDVVGHIDIVNVFRPSDQTDIPIEDALRRHRQQGDVSCIWLQQGIINPKGASKCAEAGVTYIEDACIYVVQNYVNMQE